MKKKFLWEAISFSFVALLALSLGLFFNYSSVWQDTPIGTKKILGSIGYLFAVLFGVLSGALYLLHFRNKAREEKSASQWIDQVTTNSRC